MTRSYPDFLADLPWEPIIGYTVDEHGEQLLVTHRKGDDKGLLTVAPNRSGKFVSAIGVNLICHRASLVLFDPKAESVLKGFAWWRAAVLGQRVFVFDPLKAVPDACIPLTIDATIGKPIVCDAEGTARVSAPRLRAGFNPVEAIAKSRHPVALAKAIAAAFVPIQGTNPFWSESAQSFFAAYLCFVALDPDYDKPRTMRSVWHDLVLSNITPRGAGKKLESPSEFDALLDMMAVSPAAYPFVQSEAIDFRTGAVDTVQGYRKTLKTQVGRILDDPDILECLSYTSLDFGLVQREHVTVFLCLPGWAQDIYANFFRVLLSCLFIAIEQHGLGKERHPDRTLIIMDEFASMGRAQFIREAVPRLPGYGVRFWPFVQDLGQLRTNFGDGWETFFGMAGTVQVFGGSSDMFTVKYISEVTGTYGEETTSESEQAKGGGSSRTTGMTGRPGLFPHEIATLNAEPGTELRQILIHSAKGFAFTERLRYYEDFPEFMAFQKQLNLPTVDQETVIPDWEPPQPAPSPPRPEPPPKPNEEEGGYWRDVIPGEIFQPGGRYRLDLGGSSQVWVPRPK